jgi:hypothetical protein
MEDVAGDAGGMHARQHVLAAADLAAHQRDVRLAAQVCSKT